MEFGLFIIAVFLLGASAAVLAAWAKENGRTDIMKGILWGFCIFIGCFNFPLWSERFPLEWTDLPMDLMAYSAIGTGFNSVYGTGRKLFLYPRIIIFSVIGMICRYFMEFGEVSNTYNFTVENVLIYLAVVPICIILVYEFMGRKSKTH